MPNIELNVHTCSEHGCITLRWRSLALYVPVRTVFNNASLSWQFVQGFVYASVNRNRFVQPKIRWLWVLGCDPKRLSVTWRYTTLVNDIHRVMVRIQQRERRYRLKRSKFLLRTSGFSYNLFKYLSVSISIRYLSNCNNNSVTMSSVTGGGALYH